MNRRNLLSLLLEPVKVKEIKEQLEPEEMVAECVKMLNPVETIQLLEKYESEITLKK